MTDRNCKQCGKKYTPVTGNQVVCVLCRPAYLRDTHNRRGMKYDNSKRAKEAEKRAILRIEKATEKRAEYIANYFIRTGVLLNW